MLEHGIVLANYGCVKNLLIVDDEKLTLTSLADSLKVFKDRFNVITAENGEQASRILKSMNVDLVITDLNMPVKSGFELIADMFINHSAKPIIVMSASDSDDSYKMLKALNVRNIITKPFKFEKLLKMIFEALPEI